MHTEDSQIRICCCCIPLRGGLLFWGYFKLVAVSSLFSLLFYIMSQVGAMPLYILVAITLLATIGFTIAFIYALHKEKYDQLIFFYYFSIIENILGALFVGGILLIVIVANASSLPRFFMLAYTAPLIVVIGFAIVLQTYILILLSEGVIALQGRVSDLYTSLNDIAEEDEYMST